MNMLFRSSLALIIAAGLAACGNSSDNNDATPAPAANNATAPAADPAAKETVPAPAAAADDTADSAYSRATFVGTWNVDPADLGTKVDTLIAAELNKMPPEERQMAEGMMAMMKPMMLQMLSGITMTLNDDGSATVMTPGQGGQPETLIGQWTYENNTLRVGMPNDSATDQVGGLDWVNVQIDSATRVRLTPPADEDGQTFELVMTKAQG